MSNVPTYLCDERTVIDERTNAATGETYRAVAVCDDFPSKPDCCCDLIFDLGRGYWGGASTTEMSHVDCLCRDSRADHFDYALRRFTEQAGTRDGGVELFSRWVKVFYGRKVETLQSGDYYLVAIQHEEASGVEGTLSEWQAYFDGDVYGVIIERLIRQRVSVETLTVDGDTDNVDTYEQNLWVEEDSCWGYYGDEYAIEAALETLDSYAPVCPNCGGATVPDGPSDPLPLCSDECSVEWSQKNVPA